MPSFTNAFSQQGTQDVDALIVGDWSFIGAEHNSTEYPLGNCPEGQLTIGREYYRHMGTQLPRRVDAVFLISSTMGFSGNLEEVHERNCKFALGQNMSDLTSEYVYIGGAETPQYFTFTGKRWRPGDTALVEFRIHKGLVVSEFQMGSSDEAISVPLEIEGLDDQAGEYGGAADNPLGWLFVPEPA